MIPFRFRAQKQPGTEILIKRLLHFRAQEDSPTSVDVNWIKK